MKIDLRLLKAELMFFLFLLAFLNVGAQTDEVVVWNKWCASKDTLLLFNSGNNIIQVYCKGMKPSQFKLKSLDKSLRIGTPEVNHDTLSVIAMPHADKSKQMRLAVMDAKTSKIITTVNFSSADIPEPIAQIGSLEPAKEVFKRDLLRQTRLFVKFPGSLYSYPYTVSSYTFKGAVDTGISVANVKTFFLVNYVLQEIDKVPVDSSVTFTNIKAICPRCSTRTLKDVKFKLK